MAKKKQKKKKRMAQAKVPEPHPKDFLDLIAPSAVRFNTDHAVCGDLYRCTMALRSYPATTEELALLRNLGEKSGVTLRIYTRKVTSAEEEKILHNAENKRHCNCCIKGISALFHDLKTSLCRIWAVRADRAFCSRYMRFIHRDRIINGPSKIRSVRHIKILLFLSFRCVLQIFFL